MGGWRKMTLRARQKLGKYRIVRRLAAGPYANVYESSDTIEGIRVALKIPHATLVTPEMLAQMRYDESMGPLTVHRTGGCKVCSDTGYRGRVAINELLLVSEEIQRMAVERRPSDEIAKVAQEQGMLTLREDGMEKVRLGMTTLEEVLRVVV